MFLFQKRHSEIKLAETDKFVLVLLLYNIFRMNIMVFATNNAHKLKEISHILNNSIFLKTLKDIGCSDDIPETGETLEENALQKARYINNKFGVNCFADDTGLEIEALNGEPGVYSARYAGESKSFDDNMNKVLEKLEGIANRNACFRTVIALIIDGNEFLFEGRVDGIIISEKKGVKGFGYDPIFLPGGYEKTFAEMTLEEKNRISHRALASEKLARFLNK